MVPRVCTPHLHPIPPSPCCKKTSISSSSAAAVCPPPPLSSAPSANPPPALGAIYASILSKHSCTITIAVRSTFPTISTSGYTITSTLFGTSTYHPHLVISTPTSLPPTEIFDYIFVTTKATIFDPARLPLLGYPVAPSTTIVLIQNGIGIEDPYAKAYPANKIVSAVAYIAASQPASGEVSQTGESMKLILGPFPANGTTDPILLARFNAAGVHTTWTASIQQRRWRKLLFNGCYSTVCAATGLPTLAAAETVGGRELMIALGLEIAAVAEAVGCELGKEEVEGFFEGKRGLDMVPSMLQDARRGVEMEVEAVAGNVVGLAREKGVDVPRLEAIVAVLRGVNERFRRERAVKV